MHFLFFSISLVILRSKTKACRSVAILLWYIYLHQITIWRIWIILSKSVHKRLMQACGYTNQLLRRLFMETSMIVWNQFSKSEAVVRRCSVKKVFLEISQNSQENDCARDSFLIKLQFYQKRFSGTGVFLWVLRDF